ncbi:MAG TPA: hypothetical protein VHX65_20095 [Pirellulales bacterium]|jgi:hypothetical protein|nr:hypothetical protein [Pirellulales bacterium]
MSVLDIHNRSLSVSEANEMAIQESEGRLSIVEERGQVFAVYRRFDSADDGEIVDRELVRGDNPISGEFDRRIAMSHLALTAWCIFEMARAAGPRPERMVHARARRSFATQTA